MTMTDEPIDTTATEADDALEGTDQETPDVRPVAPSEVVPPPPSDLALPPEPGTIPGGLRVVPAVNELELLGQMAVTIAAASTAPKALQGKPNDVFMVLLTARDLGVALTTAIREFHVIDGKVTLSPKVRKAMVNQHAIGQIWPDPNNNDEGATWYGRRNDLPDVIVASTYTMAMAKRVPKLTDKDNWKNYPERMLSWRALGYLLDDVFSEVGTGLYSPDELGAVTDEEGVPVIDVVANADPVRGTKAPTGHKAPPPPTITEEQSDELGRRMAEIRAWSEDAYTAALGLWTADEGGQPKLPPRRRLLLRQLPIAEAILRSIEQRLEKGEWGDRPAPTDDGATPAPAEPETPPDGPTWADEVEAMKREIENEVNALDMPTVDLRLTALDLATTGRPKDRRMRLARALVDALPTEPAADPVDGDPAPDGDER